MDFVYRVEHQKTKLGPFQTNEMFTQDLAKRAALARELRLPGDDGFTLCDIPWSFVFGCESLEKLKRWFFFGQSQAEHELVAQKLHDLGFVVREFLVEDCDILRGQSGCQVAFNPHEARVEGYVSTLPVSALLAA